ncbi:MAG TPA: hypothetical protein VFJ72_16170 [Rubrobacteraceae bacterium]|nr:hypothetical protein [Rubrobacteraceae bacterium]
MTTLCIQQPSGVRRDYFRVRQGAWLEATRGQVSVTMVFWKMAERGLDLQGTDSAETRRNMEEMRDFYAHWERELPAIFERWEKEKQ